MALLARRQPGSRRRMLADINVVPYVDVMLVLVVILMVAAPFVNPSIVDLPTVGKGRQQQQKAVVIEVIVNPDGSLRMRERTPGSKPVPVDVPALVAAITAKQKADPSTAVVIAADKNVRYEHVTTVMDALYKAEVRKVGLLVTPPPR